MNDNEWVDPEFWSSVILGELAACGVSVQLYVATCCKLIREEAAMAETASLYLNDDAPLRFDAEVVCRAAADHVKESSGHQAGNRSKFVEDMVEERLNPGGDLFID